MTDYQLNSTESCDFCNVAQTIKTGFCPGLLRRGLDLGRLSLLEQTVLGRPGALLIRARLLEPLSPQDGKQRRHHAPTLLECPKTPSCFY